jgi:hypothetical protein
VDGGVQEHRPGDVDGEAESERDRREPAPPERGGHDERDGGSDSHDRDGELRRGELLPSAGLSAFVLAREPAPGSPDEDGEAGAAEKGDRDDDGKEPLHTPQDRGGGGAPQPAPLASPFHRPDQIKPYVHEPGVHSCASADEVTLSVARAKAIVSAVPEQQVDPAVTH